MNTPQSQNDGVLRNTLSEKPRTLCFHEASTDNLECCFIVPPHIEKRTQQNAKEVTNEIRKRREGVLKFKNSTLYLRPRNVNLEDQDIFTAKRTFRLPGWKLADTEEEADLSYNRSVNICWDNTQEVLDYYKSVLNYDLKKNLDNQVVSTVDVGDFFNNAFFNGEQMAYGEGDGIYFKDFCFDYTVVCHELGHGVVSGTVPLIYQGQSGALNESYADVFAICFHHRKLGKDFLNLSKADWMIGEKCVVGTGALRSFTKTKARPDNSPLGPDNDPRHMRQRYTGKEDNGGVHINSSIINHAFYKVCKYIGGNSWDKPLTIWYALLKNSEIPPNCSFKLFARKAVRKAKQLYGKRGARKVRRAFGEVGL